MKSITTVGAALAAVLIGSTAVAQDQDAGLLQEIVVTATKREQSLQDVPIAVTVTSIETIQKASIQDVTDLASIVPSLRVTTLQTSTQTNFVIRGFGNGANNPGIEPSVGVFIDGVYRSRSAGAIGDLVDVSRVEVLRGPQSTLFGQNASAGVISVTTQKPQFENAGFVEGTFGNYNQMILKGRVTGPLTDSLAYSLAGTVNQRDGYFTEMRTNSKLNDRDRWELRGQLLWNVNDDVEVRVIADTSKIDEICCGVSNLRNGPTGAAVGAVGGRIFTGPFSDRANYLDKLPINLVENNGVSLHVEWNASDALSFTSITALRSQKTDFDYDFDFTSAQLGTVNRNQGDIDTLTQEFRLAFDNGGPIRGLAGVYYITEEVDYKNTIRIGAGFRPYASLLAGGPNSLAGIEAAIGAPAGSFFRAGTGNFIDTFQESEAYTLFSQIDVDLHERLTLTAGIAYTNTDKDIDFKQDSNELFSSLNFVDIGFALIRGQLTAAGIPANFAATFADNASVADGVRIPCYRPPAPFGALTGPICNPLLGLYPLQFLSPVVPFRDSSSDSKATYTLRLTYALDDYTNLYGGVSTGYKATSWNLSRDSKPLAPATPPRSPLGGALNPWYPRFGTRQAGPEESTVLEFGMKGRWPKFAYNIAVFEQEIKGFQSNLFLGTGFVLANAGKQSTTGTEIELQYKPVPAWQFDIAATLLNPVYDEFRGAQGISGPIDLSGTRPAGIHERSISYGATYNWSVGSINGFIRADVLSESGVQVLENVPSAVASRNVSTANASIGADHKGWSYLLWARNLNDDAYLLSAFPSPAQAGSFSGYPNQPRTYGFTVRKAF